MANPDFASSSEICKRRGGIEGSAVIFKLVFKDHLCNSSLKLRERLKVK